MADFGKCEEIADNTKIILEENRSKICFINENRNKIRKIKIDGCVIKDERIRCDYLLILPNETELYVELKGGNVTHAVVQIEETIKAVSKDKQKQPKISFVIPIRNKLLGTDKQNIQKKFKKYYNSDLLFKNSPCEYNLEKKTFI